MNLSFVFKTGTPVFVTASIL